MDMNNTGNRTIAIIVLVILIIGAWYIGRTQPSLGGIVGTVSNTSNSAETSSANSNTSGTAETSGTGSLAANGESVSVANQPAGATVAASSLYLSQAGWIAIRDNEGRTLGAAWFPAGTQTAASVPLLRATTAGQTYQVLLYADDGDKQFDLHKDTLITNADGSVAGTTFSAQ